MKIKLGISIALLMMTTLFPVVAHAAPDTWVFFGCVSDDAGIYRSTLDSETGELSKPERIHAGFGMSFLAISPDGTKLYAVQSGKPEGKAVAFSLDAKSGAIKKLNEQSIGSRGACHISVTPDGKTVSTADYGSGCVASFAVNDDGSLKERDAQSFFKHEGSSVNEKRQKKPHAHCVVPSPDGRYVYSADLGADAVFVYRVDAPGKLTQREKVKIKNLGGGPRHFAFHKDGKFAFTNLEMTSEITAFRVQPEGKLEELATVSTLPSAHEGNSTSELLCHPSGNYFFCANRGHNSIASFRFGDGKLTPLGHESCGGDVPRNFGISPKGNWIITANQKSKNVAVLKVDSETGKLQLMKDAGYDLPTPMCVRYLPMAK